MKKNIFSIAVVFFLTLTMLLTASCVNTRQATYFNDLGDSSFSFNVPIPESKIQKNDLLNISVSSLNPEASALFNNTISSANGINNTTTSTTSSVAGYLVSSEGTLQFPILGVLKVEGMTKDELKKIITKKILDNQLLKDPIVNVRFLNFRVTVLGEVKDPMVVSVPNEKISLLEAIGMAGDLTIYGQRDNVLIIREEDGQKSVKRLNLNSNELLSSPYYYLKSNDVVYVAPNKARVASAGMGQQRIGIILSALTFIVVIVDRVIR